MDYNTDIVEKYQLLKDAFLQTSMINDVMLIKSEGEFNNLVQTVSTPVVAVMIDRAVIFSRGMDGVLFRVVILDKLTSLNDQAFLSSVNNKLTALRLALSTLNYKMDEDVIVNDISFGVYDDDGLIQAMTFPLDFTLIPIRNVER